jgi:glycosyltransferase involved in cell wall biosynthesis
MKVRADTTAPFTIGWIGSPSTTTYLPLIAPALQQIAQQGSVRFITIGADPIVIDGVDVEQRAWSEQTEVRDLLDCDIGVMPLPDDPWARGKCAFKLIQYMACGLPVIASPIGANRDVVTAECGLFADNQGEWVRAISRLRDDVNLRFALGVAGRVRAERLYSLDSQSTRVANLLQEAVRMR